MYITTQSNSNNVGDRQTQILFRKTRSTTKLFSVRLRWFPVLSTSIIVILYNDRNNVVELFAKTFGLLSLHL